MNAYAVNEIRQWLQALGVEQYAEAFVRNDIDVGLLATLSDADLRELGVASMGHRKRILSAIENGTHKLSSATQAADAVRPGATDVAQVPAPSPRADAERRQMTVMFCDLVGATALSTQRDPEELRDVLAGYHAAVSEAVTPFDGFVAQLLGDGVLVYFGYPAAHEDEAVRAVRAAIEVIRLVSARQFGPGLRVQARVGIATGLVVVGEIGAGTPAAEPGVTGEVPNLAARLQGEAPAMGIVISDETARQVSGVFDWRPMGELQLKGFAVPQRAWLVTGQRQLESRFAAVHTRSTSELVGRAGELDLLQQRWSAATEGDGEVEAVLVSAEAGMGKSHLAHSLREHVQSLGAMAVVWQCSPDHRSSPLYPVQRWLEQTLQGPSEEPVQSRLAQSLRQRGIELPQDAVRLLSSWLPHGEVPPDIQSLAPPELRRRTQTALVELLRAAARRQPILLLIEDAHWIDPSTEEVVVRALGLIRRAPLLALVTCRPEYQPEWPGQVGATKLSLNRLSRSACTKLVAALAHVPLPTAVLDEILARTDGVPLYIEEVTRTVLRSGALDRALDGWQLRGTLQALSVPSTLHDSLMARLDQLSSAREVAQVAAVIGREFDARLLASALRLEPRQVDALLQELGRAGLLGEVPAQGGTTYAFRHALIRDVAYGSMLKAVRAQHHRNIAHALSELDPDCAARQPEVLAQHLQEANEPEAACPLWVRAGELAVARGANSEAAAHFRAALQAADRAGQCPLSDEQRLSIMFKRSAALANTGGYAATEFADETLAARDLASRVGRIDAYLESLCRSAPGFYAQGRYADMLSGLAAAGPLENLDLPAKLMVMCHISRGVPRLMSGDIAGAVFDFERAIEFRSQVPAWFDYAGADPAVIARAYLMRSLIYRDDLHRVEPLSAEALDLAALSGHMPSVAWARQMQAWGLYFTASYRECLRVAVEVQRESDSVGLSLRSATSRLIAGLATIGLGDLAAGRDMARAGLHRWAESGGKFHGTEYASTIADALLLAGDASGALEFIEFAERVERETDERVYSGELLRLRGRWLAFRGEGAAAQASFEAALVHAQRIGAARFERCARDNLRHLRT